MVWKDPASWAEILHNGLRNAHDWAYLKFMVMGFPYMITKTSGEEGPKLNKARVYETIIGGVATTLLVTTATMLIAVPNIISGLKGDMALATYKIEEYMEMNNALHQESLRQTALFEQQMRSNYQKLSERLDETSKAVYQLQIHQAMRSAE